MSSPRAADKASLCRATCCQQAPRQAVHMRTSDTARSPQIAVHGFYLQVLLVQNAVSGEVVLFLTNYRLCRSMMWNITACCSQSKALVKISGLNSSNLFADWRDESLTPAKHKTHLFGEAVGKTSLLENSTQAKAAHCHRATL